MSGLGRSVLVLCAWTFGLASPLSAQVTVRFEPPQDVVQAGALFDVDIVADITQPVVGWGLDLSITQPMVALFAGVSAFGPAWVPAYAPDGDGLAGLAFPNSVVGNDILLARIMFLANEIGPTDLLASFTPGDLTEGFPLDPTGFAQVTFQPGHITVTPEPATLGLLVLGSLATLGRRWRPSLQPQPQPRGARGFVRWSVSGYATASGIRRLRSVPRPAVAEVRWSRVAWAIWRGSASRTVTSGVSRLVRSRMLVGVVAMLVAAPAGAQTSGMIFAANVPGGVESNNVFDTNPPHTSTRCVDVKHGVSYGIVNWATRDPNAPISCAAGQQARLAKWNDPNDNYERLGHWGRGVPWFDPFRFSRGVVRYDADTFVWLSSEYVPLNANNVRPPSLFQTEYRAAWFDANQPQTDDQYIQGATMVNHMVRAAPRPFGIAGTWYDWYPGPPDPNVIVPPGPANLAWVGGGQTGKLQFAETLTAHPGTVSWFNDPNNPSYLYITGFAAPNDKMVDDIWGLETGVYGDPNNPPKGTLYRAEKQSGGTRSGSTAIDLEAFYGETETVLYMTQMEGRIYKLVGGKELGYRRAAGQPAPGAKVTGYAGTEPVLTPNNRYAAAFDSGFPTIGDDPNAVPPAPHGRGITATELFSDAGNPLGRHYTGLGVDAGGRVYAVSERFLDSTSGIEPAYIRNVGGGSPGSGGDVYNWGGTGLYTLEDPAAPFDGVNIKVNDLIILTGGTGINPVPTFRILAMSGDKTIAYLDQDPGDSLGMYDVGYRVYPAGVNPRPRPSVIKASGTNADVGDGGNPSTPPFWLADATKNFVTAGVAVGDTLELPYQAGSPWISGRYTVQSVATVYVQVDRYMGNSAGASNVPYTIYGLLPGVWTSEAMLDVYKADGTLASSANLNNLVRPDGVALNTYRYDAALQIPGIIVHGDVEVDPTVSGGNTTRLWINCAGGDGDPNTADGLDLLVVDVTVNLDGSVGATSYVGGIDDGDLPIGIFYNGNYNTAGWDPFALWVCIQDVEFDGLGNMVYMGNRAENDNRYIGVTAPDVATAVANMGTEAGLSQDAVVSITGWTLDMDLYGFGTDFGLAFDNSPLTNFGSPNPVGPPLRTLLSSDPVADGTLPKVMNNCILLTFDGPIAWPPTGPALSITSIGGGLDLGEWFIYSIGPGGAMLKAKESGAIMVNETWYRITPAAGFGVQAFVRDFCTLQGDADGNGQVLAQDYFQVKNRLFLVTDARYDLDGSGAVLAQDYFVVKNHLFDAKPPKP